MNNSPIIVFDSGIGSMSIIKGLRKELPNENLIYFADKANFPYGTKSQNNLFKIVHNTISYLERFKPKLIIIASTTPTMQIIDKITLLTNIPLIGVRPPFEMAIKMTKTKHVAILATESTIRSNELDKQIKTKIPQDIFISKYNVSPLISLIEDGTFLRNRKKIEEIILQILGNMDGIDITILASTHLPFIADQLNLLYPSIKFIDPAMIITNEVKIFLNKNNLHNKNKNSKMRILVTDNKKEFEEILRHLGLKEKIEEVFWTF